MIALLPLLACCASSGLYNMSDDWCAAHVNASPARCPEKQQERRVAVNEQERGVANRDVAANE